ncbi:DUF1289 domain-containing protein [Novosphingobium cyanobacteriorum]|uniref:DUF1289 domain-containing protein n=1 Tax=Novosphingobium cyanobacteriorum TaxID=3024215 RepID=A0ABT6CFX2_9SPHN|nr:DUF1289 domain-containing protein [Novosphingobium cyanobacteriorum]MDF8332816.1 DUF1289 domain-containing protein [Novosphingobium cyanobacteriorum]
MTAPVAEDVPSPCIGVCVVQADTCTGCHRTLAEIAAWFTAAVAEKRAILKAVAARQSISDRSM